VLSSLGVQFVPRHEIVASELVRVCRAGGTIALGNWAADGFIGRFWTIMGPYLPPPPDYASPPAGWGRPEHVEQLFAEYPVQLTFERDALDFEAESAEAFIDMMADFYGPLVQARNKLTAGRLLVVPDRNHGAQRCWVNATRSGPNVALPAGSGRPSRSAAT
jgi:hypothetical protein